MEGSSKGSARRQFPWSFERSSSSGDELVHSDFVSLLASLRVWSPKIIGDIGVGDDMTQHMLLEGYIHKLENYILASKPQVCESATQEGSTFGFHTQASCPLWGTYADKFSSSEEGLTFRSPM